MFEQFSFGNEVGFVYCILDSNQQLVEVWWFGNKVESVFFYGFYCCVDVSMFGNYDDGGIWC